MTHVAAAQSYGSAVVLLAGFLLVCPPGMAQTPTDVNTVKSIRTVKSRVEIELHSSRPFPIRDEVIVLRIGKHEFSRSRFAADGSLHTRVFSLSAAEFSALADGEAMSVGFGRGAVDGQDLARGPRDRLGRWDFGRLDKSLLDR